MIYFNDLFCSHSVYQKQSLFTTHLLTGYTSAF